MEPRECPQCHQQFVPTDRRQKYCDRDCRTEFLNAKHRTAEGPIKRRGPRKRYEKRTTCLWCSKKLPPRKHRFCDEGCSETYWNNSRKTGKAATFHILTDVDPEARSADCSICGPTKILKTGGTKKFLWRCKVAVYSASQQKSQRESGWKKRGIKLTMEKYLEMLDEQEGKCAICREAFDDQTPHVDHCHARGHVRGLLCSTCNTGIGYFKDNWESLALASTYLIRHNP